MIRILVHTQDDRVTFTRVYPANKERREYVTLAWGEGETRFSDLTDVTLRAVATLLVTPHPSTHDILFCSAFDPEGERPLRQLTRLG